MYTRTEIYALITAWHKTLCRSYTCGAGEDRPAGKRKREDLCRSQSHCASAPPASAACWRCRPVPRPRGSRRIPSSSSFRPGPAVGADQMARAMQGIITKHNLSKQSVVVINKSGGAGGEGFLDVKNAKGNDHKLIITLSNLFTTPLGTGIPFTWKDMTPVAMMALDEFVLWVNAEKPYTTVKEYVDAIKAAPDNQFKMGGTGSKQEDQIITVAVQKAAGKKLTYIPYKGGGEVAVQLVGNHVDSTVNNPIEAVAHWRAGKLRPLCVFDAQQMSYDEQIADGKGWKDIPTCKSQGLDVEYLMLRGIFMSPKATKDQVEYYVDLFK